MGMASWNFGEFSVHSARTFIDDILLPFVGDVTRWVKVVPIKLGLYGVKIARWWKIDIPAFSCHRRMDLLGSKSTRMELLFDDIVSSLLLGVSIIDVKTNMIGFPDEMY
ncbi:hypothetical protein Tco_0860965 [Tanacetum coccineum]|uniref:Uncharacterized protein n=1 Tax=Tanacetum coccineum TaxID=301880 RepID=A0ABQ5BK63_9ASTR